MPTELTTKPVERSTFVITAVFRDEDGALTVPNAPLTWTLTDDKGTVVNSREDVVVTPASTINIVLSGLDLAVGTGLNGVVRKVLLEGTYTSSLGTLPIKDEVTFKIHNTTELDGIT